MKQLISNKYSTPWTRALLTTLMIGEKHQVISRFKEVAMQVLELAAENAKTNPFSGGGTLYWDTDNINKQSILDTIKQVK